MRFLIIFTLFAYAAGAPTETVPLLKNTTPTPIEAAIPEAASTDSLGDIGAAAIDAQVKAEDASRAAADQAREARELLTENPHEGIMEANDLAKEKSEQAFWNAEEQKWQALDAMMVAQAQAQAAVARTSYVPYMVSSFPESLTAVQAIAPLSENQVAAVKTVEPETQAISEAMNPADSSHVESANLKATVPIPSNMETQKSLFFQSIPQSPIYVAPLSISPLQYNQPFVAPIGYVQPNMKVVASQAIHSVAW